MKRKVFILGGIVLFSAVVLVWLTVGTPVLKIVKINAATLEQQCVSFEPVDQLCVDGFGTIDGIEGFTYDPNFAYTIVVLITKPKPDRLDSSSASITLLKIISKTAEKKNESGYFADEGIFYAKGKVDSNSYTRCINTDLIINCGLPYYATNNPASNFEILGYVPINYISGFTYESNKDYDFAFVRTRSDTFGHSGNNTKPRWYKYVLYKE